MAMNTPAKTINRHRSAACSSQGAATKTVYLRERRRQILANTAARLIRGEDPDTAVMPALFRELAAERIIDATLGFIVTDLGEAMTLGFMEGFDRAMIQRCLTLDFGQAICGTVAATGRPMHVTNIQRNLDPLADLVRSAGINAYACEPLIVGDRLLGTVSFASRSRSCFAAEDLLFFREIAKHVAIARDRARRSANADAGRRRDEALEVLA
ncbi:MAG TPA: GAF domain-containing protein [Sphingomicrobium sp.]|nr:GAF domain-containing protein [Sphingomicrobium sp.]